MNVYFISGLGADERIFQKIVLPEQFHIIHIKYLPALKGEPLAAYCKRLAGQIDTSQPFSLVGVSFGGIVAVELKKIIDPVKTIIISSISSNKGMPFYYRLTGQLKILNLVPVKLLNVVGPATYWYFGVKSKKEKELLHKIIKDTSPQFLRWALNEILNWKIRFRQPGIFHIHGSGDRLFPVGHVKADWIIDGAGHLITYTHANEISSILQDQLSPGQEKA